MKSVKQILSHLPSSSPNLQTLERHQHYNWLRSLLPPRFQNAVRFMYQKNQTLFFVLEHQCYLMEFNYNLDLIKALLKKLQEEKGWLTDIATVKCFVTHQGKKTETESSTTEPHYHEHAIGDFLIHSSDPDLIERFQAIQNLCKNS